MKKITIRSSSLYDLKTEIAKKTSEGWNAGEIKHAVFGYKVTFTKELEKGTDEEIKEFIREGMQNISIKDKKRIRKKVCWITLFFLTISALVLMLAHKFEMLF
jgi:hypothetical protein